MSGAGQPYNVVFRSERRKSSSPAEYTEYKAIVSHSVSLFLVFEPTLPDLGEGTTVGEVIHVTEKKQFIKWFLENYELQNREAEWLLQYLCSNDKLLERVHFIDNFKNLPKTILMSTKCVQMTPFKFYKNKRVTSDVEKAFLDIHNHPDEDVYIGLFFRERKTCPEYAAVLESNPAEQGAESVDALVGLQAELILDEAVRRYRKEQLIFLIDEALDRGDRERFMQLSEEWRQWKKEEELG
jgi:uncharacterized protein YpiB (UPF0302 family)